MYTFVGLVTCSPFKNKYISDFSNIKTEYKKYATANESLEFEESQKLSKIKMKLTLKLEKLEIIAITYSVKNKF